MYFTYPLDCDFILRKKKSLKKRLLDSVDYGYISKNIAILGGSSTHEIKEILELFLLDCGIVPKFYESDYNRFYEEAVFNNDALNAFKPDIIYIHTSFFNLNFTESVDDTLKKYHQIWQSLSSKYQCAIIQNNFELPPYRIYGNLDATLPQGKTHYVNTLNLALSNMLHPISNIYLNDINSLSARIGLDKWYDLTLYARSKYALSLDTIPYLAWNLASIIKAIFGLSKKALVLDLDNTLWGGVIGDDGINGIQIGTETAIGECYVMLQSYIKELKNRGIMLSVCSKNELDNAKSGFSHPSSILSIDDFISFKANWNLKSENIKEIAKDINIGLNTLVFVDDNPAERELVANELPNVAQALPHDLDLINPLDFIESIDRNAYFETVSFSNEDVERNNYYLQNKAREEQSGSFTSYDDFLKSLSMKAEIKSFSAVYMERIAQLTNKTNQFNLTTKRYTQAHLEAIANDDSYIALYGRLSDKFGDNGLISVLIAQCKGEIAHIDLWLMSCRVLKRGMEYAMLDSLIYHARKKGIRILKGYYCKSTKNAMVSDLYADFGFGLVGKNDEDSVWQLEIDKYKSKEFFIGVEYD